jgi:HlyD family secretion protein
MEKARSSVQFTVTAKGKAALVGLAVVGIACALVAPGSALHAQDAARSAIRAESSDEKNWQAVAPGRIEPVSGEIKIASPLVGLIGEVLVKAGDKVSAGEPLVRLADREAQARIAAAEAQIALRRRARNDQAPSSRAGDRRKAEDAVADGEKAVVQARSALDRAALERRADRASDADLEAARVALSRAQDRLKQLRADLRKLEADTATPLPTQTEGQLNIARTELWAAEAAIEKLTVRAPIAGTVLQVNAKPGELAAPSVAQPLVLLGDISALRVRAELDERDFGEIKIGQAVSVRPDAFRGREFAGKVTFIAPLVEPSRNSRGQRNQTDVDVVEVLVELAEPGPLAVGMKVDVYFRYDGAKPPG